MMDFVRFAVTASCLLSVVHGQEPKIARSINQETKPAGQEGRLSCYISNKGFATVIWQKGEGRNARLISRDEVITKRNPQNAAGEYKYHIYVKSLSSSQAVYTLGVRRLTMDDGGKYTCMLMLPGVDNSLYPRQDGELTVQLPPKILTSDTTTLLEVIAGETARLVCAASGVPEPKISWSRSNGQALPNGQLTVYGKELIIKNVDDTARGVYKCQADNNVRPPATSDITIRVRYPPRLVPFRAAVGQAPDKNYDVELSCRISGDPMPDLSWFKISRAGRQEKIMNDNKHEIHVIEMHPGQATHGMVQWLNLRITNLQSGDYGNYTCRGTNMYGKGDGHISLYYTSTCQNTGTRCQQDSRSAAAGIRPTLSVLVLIIGAIYMLIC